LEIQLEKLSPVEARIQLSVETQDFAHTFENKLKEYGKKVRLNGFRPGKVPAGIIRKMYGKAIKAEEINNIVSKELGEYIKQQSFTLLGDPLPTDSNQFESIDWENQQSFRFSFDVGMAADFSPSYSKTKCVRYKISLSEETVQETIEDLQKRFAEVAHPDTVDAGDFVTGDWTSALTNDKGNGMIPMNKISEKAMSAMIGVAKGSTITIDLSEAFGEDISAKSMFTGIDKEVVATLGNTLTFTITEITRNVPATLDQAFFNKVFGEGVVDSEESFRNKIMETISENYSREAEQLLNDSLQKSLTENAAIELPAAFLKRWLLAKKDNTYTADEVEAQYNSYESSLKWTLLRDKIAQEQALKVEEAEIVEKAKSILRAQFMQYGMLGQLEDRMDEFAMNYLKRDEGANFSRLYEALLSQKVYEAVKPLIEIKEETISVEDFKKLTNELR
jgi:trigger factor